MHICIEKFYITWETLWLIRDFLASEFIKQLIRYYIIIYKWR